MVVHDGRVVAAWGDVARTVNVASVRKSVLSALYGIAVAEGRINLKRTLAELGIQDNEPGLTTEEREATVRDLLMSRSGVYHGAAYETRDMGAARPPRGSHPPGAFWYSNNWDFNALGTIYTRLTRESFFEAVEKRIARPIGMEDYEGWRGGRLTYESVSQHPAYVMPQRAGSRAFRPAVSQRGCVGREAGGSVLLGEGVDQALVRRFLGHGLRLPVVRAAERLGSRRTRLRGARLPRPGGRRDSVEAPRRGTDRRPA